MENYIVVNGKTVPICGTAIIHNKVAWEVPKGTEGAFCYGGAWYVYERKYKAYGRE